MSASEKLEILDAKFSSDWLTVEEAAIYLRVFSKNGLPAINTIRNLVSQGRIPFYKPCKRLLFKKSELQLFIEKTRTAGGRYG